MTREQARELLMQMVFQMEAQNDFSEEAKDVFLKSFPVEGKAAAYLEEMYAVISSNLEKIDLVISRSSDNWKTERMARVDFAILRISVAEMMFRDDIPDAVSINEAVNLAKKFGTDTSQKFVNGLLGKAAACIHEQ